MNFMEKCEFNLQIFRLKVNEKTSRNAHRAVGVFRSVRLTFTAKLSMLWLHFHS